MYILFLKHMIWKAGCGIAPMAILTLHSYHSHLPRAPVIWAQRLSDSALLPTSHVMTQKMNGK